jgi:hypothetical protein
LRRAVISFESLLRGDAVVATCGLDAATAWL